MRSDRASNRNSREPEPDSTSTNALSVKLIGANVSRLCTTVVPLIFAIEVFVPRIFTEFAGAYTPPWIISSALAPLPTENSGVLAGKDDDFPHGSGVMAGGVSGGPKEAASAPRTTARTFGRIAFFGGVPDVT